jgi:hypothetical protein
MALLYFQFLSFGYFGVVNCNKAPFFFFFFFKFHCNVILETIYFLNLRKVSYFLEILFPTLLPKKLKIEFFFGENCVI